MSNLMQTVADVDSETYDYLLKTASDVSNSPFKDEIVAELDDIIKTAEGAFGAHAGHFGKQLAVGVGSGIALSMAGDLYSAVKRGITKSHNYRNMMRDNEDLNELPTKDVKRIFGVLHQFNPEYSSNSTVAGSFVRQQASLGTFQFDANSMNSLVGSHKGIVDARSLHPGNYTQYDADEHDLSKAQLGKLKQDMEFAPSKHELNRSQTAKTRQEMTNSNEQAARDGELHKLRYRKAEAEAIMADANASNDPGVIGMVAKARYRNPRK